MIKQVQLSSIKYPKDKYTPAALGIILVLLLIPNTLLLGGYLFPLLIFPYYVWLLSKSAKGASFVIISLALCIPQVAGLKEAGLFNGITLSLRLCILYGVLYYSRSSFSIPNIGAFVLGGIMILLDVVYGTKNWFLWINTIIYTHLFFLVCLHDKIHLETLYKLSSLLVIIYGFYAILQFHLGIVPYLPIYISANPLYTTSVHAVGLSGHYIILSVVLLLYNSILLICANKDRNIKIFLMLFVLYVGLISASRTFMVGIVVEYIIFVILNPNIIKSKVVLYVVFSFLLAILGVLIIGGNYIDYALSRFSDSTAHREAAFPTVMKIFSNFTFGVGPDNINKYVGLYAAEGIIDGFGTLDNFFLTEIASYGILAFVPIWYYLYYYIMSIFMTRKRPVFFRYMCYLFLPWCAVGFSFDVEAYTQLNVITFGLIGYLYNISNYKHGRRFCNYSELQYNRNYK